MNCNTIVLNLVFLCRFQVRSKICFCLKFMFGLESIDLPTGHARAPAAKPSYPGQVFENVPYSLGKWLKMFHTYLPHSNHFSTDENKEHTSL